MPNEGFSSQSDLLRWCRALISAVKGELKVNEQFGKVWPDGNWLAYQSDEAVSEEIYLRQFPQPARSWRISTSGGVNPFWRGDGKELYFVSGNKLMAVSVNGGTEFQAGTPATTLRDRRHPIRA